MTAIRSGASSPSSPINTPIADGQGATPSRPASPAAVPQTPLEPLRPDASPSKPRANSLIASRFPEANTTAASTSTTARTAGRNLENAPQEILDAIIEHLPTTPDRIPLTQTSRALRLNPGLKSDVPLEAIKAWSALRRGKSLTALDSVIKHLQSANDHDKMAVATEFLKHGLKREEDPEHLPHLEHLYQASSNIIANHPETGKALIKGLFDYGVGYLPAGTRGAGLGHVSHAVKVHADTLGASAGEKDAGQLKQLAAQLAEMSDVMTEVHGKFMAVRNAETIGSEAGTQFAEMGRSIAAAKKMHDFSLIRQLPGVQLPNASVNSVLELIDELTDTQAELKLTLASELVGQFDKLALDDAAQFISKLKGALAPQQNQAQAAALVEQLDKLKAQRHGIVQRANAALGGAATGGNEEKEA